MSQVSTSDRGPVRIITLTNPPRGYMNATNAAELLVALQDALAAPEIRVIVFTGGLPGVFIRHYDVGEIKAVEGALRAGAIQPGGDRAASPVYALIDLMLACEKSTIAAINGICMGGGCEFALCCDMRIAESGDYTIGLPETRLGIIPGVGGLQLLARTVGLSRAREMVMRGRVVGPNEALRIGLVDEVVSVTLDRALEIAAELAANPPHAVAATKRLARRVAAGETREQGLLTSATEFMGTLVDSDETPKLIDAFLEGGEDILAG
ncbi:MAG: enoyl-CoA hydratase/isomerase family protein [Novosphingobium sp.]